jgi:copper chaperone CopZ
VDETLGTGPSLSVLDLHVPDMECEHCAASVESCLASLLGVCDVSVNSLARVVRLRYDAGVTEQEIRRALAELGYPTLP